MKILNVNQSGKKIKQAKKASKLPSRITLKISSEKITLMHESSSEYMCGIEIDTEITEAVSRLPDHTELDLSVTCIIDNSASLALVQKAASKKSLNMHEVVIDTEIAEAVLRLPDYIEVDLSGSKFIDNFASIALIQKAATLKCGIWIDTEIAEAVCRLPDHTQLDLSFNWLIEIDLRLLLGVLPHMPKDNDIDMTGWGITIDADIVKALSKMPQLESVKAPYNKLTPEAAREFSMSQLQRLELSRCSIDDTVCVSLMISLSKHCPLMKRLYLRGNNLRSDEWCRHVQMKELDELWLFENPCMKDQHCSEKVKKVLQEINPRLKICTI